MPFAVFRRSSPVFRKRCAKTWRGSLTAQKWDPVVVEVLEIVETSIDRTCTR